MITINYKTPTNSKRGKGKWVKTAGISVSSPDTSNLILVPLDKDGYVMSMYLEIPKENLPELLPIFGTDDLLNELKKRNADPAKFTEKQTLIASLLETLYVTCDEEIDKNRDKGAAFEEIQNITSQIKCLIGLQR